VAALDRGGPRPVPPVGPPAIKDHPHAVIIVERVRQRFVAVGEVPGHDEQHPAAG